RYSFPTRRSSDLRQLPFSSEPAVPEKVFTTGTPIKDASFTVFTNVSCVSCASLGLGAIWLLWQLKALIVSPLSCTFSKYAFRLSSLSSNSSNGQNSLPGFPPVPISTLSNPASFTLSNISSKVLPENNTVNTPSFIHQHSFTFIFHSPLTV